MRKTGKDKICGACGGSFYAQAHRLDAKFCSMKCLWAGRRKRDRKEVLAICHQCGGRYSVAPSRKTKTKFCSFRCSGIFNAPARARNRRRAKASPGNKVCSGCKEEKPFDDFWKRPGNHDGYRGKCIRCSEISYSEWRAANADRKRAHDRDYYREHSQEIGQRNREKYAANPEAFAKRYKVWAEANPEKVTAANQRKRTKHGEKLRAGRRKHYQDNKSRYKAQSVARQKHIRQATPAWADMEKIAAIYAEAERLTAETGIAHHVDHFYPLRGKAMCGLHVEGNLQIVHAIVNLRKSNRVAETNEPTQPNC